MIKSRVYCFFDSQCTWKQMRCLKCLKSLNCKLQSLKIALASHSSSLLKHFGTAAVLNGCHFMCKKLGPWLQNKMMKTMYHMFIIAALGVILKTCSLVAVNRVIVCIPFRQFWFLKTQLRYLLFQMLCEHSQTSACCLGSVFWCWYFTAMLCVCYVCRSSGEHAVLFSRETQSSLSQFFFSSISLVTTTRLSTALGRIVMHRCSTDHASRGICYLFMSVHIQRHLLYIRSVHCHSADYSCLVT